jgi:hypothetical protein
MGDREMGGGAVDDGEVEGRSMDRSALETHARPAQPAGAVLVMGMARSGTSAVTRLLALLGVQLGPEEDLLAPREDVNPRGYFEHRPIVRLNAELLRRMGGSWRAPPQLAPGWQRAAELEDLRAQARQLLATTFAGARLWGFKDPRTSLTLPFWSEVIGDASYVICHRRPLDSARSLERRNGLTLEEGVALWLRYTASAVANTAGRRRIIVGYEELFRDGWSLAGELAAFLGAEPGGRPELRAAVEGWIDDDLRHHAGTLRELVEHPAVSADALTLDLLLELAIAARASERGLGGAGGGGPVGDALDGMALRLAKKSQDRGAVALQSIEDFG